LQLSGFLALHDAFAITIVILHQLHVFLDSIYA
jgi:hypothetical protein